MIWRLSFGTCCFQAAKLKTGKPQLYRRLRLTCLESCISKRATNEAPRL